MKVDETTRLFDEAKKIEEVQRYLWHLIIVHWIDEGEQPWMDALRGASDGLSGAAMLIARTLKEAQDER